MYEIHVGMCNYEMQKRIYDGACISFSADGTAWSPYTLYKFQLINMTRMDDTNEIMLNGVARIVGVDVFATDKVIVQGIDALLMPASEEVSLHYLAMSSFFLASPHLTY